MDIDKKSVGTAIKSARLKEKLTQEALAELIDLTPMFIKHIEAGRRFPSLETLHKIACTLNMSVDAIFFSQKDETQELRERIMRKLNDCSHHDLNVIYSTIEAMTKTNTN